MINQGVSFLLPLTSDRIPEGTVQSVQKQAYKFYEIIILQNGVSYVPEKVGVREVKPPLRYSNVPIRKLQIRSRGKGNALNIGIRYARYEFFCVLDADCVLDEHAIHIAMRHFENENVSAVGGRLKTMSEKKNIFTFLQKVEYMKTFNIWREIVDSFNANCLISGAYGIFRKYDVELVYGYDTDTVGEDMELILSLQELLRGIGRKVVYESDSICYTATPATLHRLLRQRDRWQRGLLDCLLKHERLMFNPEYGLLGCAVIPCQFFAELIGPIFAILHIIHLILAAIEFETYFILHMKRYWPFYFIYLLFEVSSTCLAEYLEYTKWYVCITKIPKAVVAVVLGTVLSVPLAFARLWGMISFPWRRLEW